MRGASKLGHFRSSINLICPSVRLCTLDEMMEIALEIDEEQLSPEVYRKRFQSLISLCSSEQSCIDDTAGMLNCWYKYMNSFERDCLRYVLSRARGAGSPSIRQTSKPRRGTVREPFSPHKGGLFLSNTCIRANKLSK